MATHDLRLVKLILKRLKSGLKVPVRSNIEYEDIRRKLMAYDLDDDVVLFYALLNRHFDDTNNITDKDLNIYDNNKLKHILELLPLDEHIGDELDEKLFKYRESNYDGATIRYYKDKDVIEIEFHSSEIFSRFFNIEDTYVLRRTGDFRYDNNETNDYIYQDLQDEKRYYYYMVYDEAINIFLRMATILNSKIFIEKFSNDIKDINVSDIDEFMSYLTTLGINVDGYGDDISNDLAEIGEEITTNTIKQDVRDHIKSNSFYTKYSISSVYIKRRNLLRIISKFPQMDKFSDFISLKDEIFPDELMGIEENLYSYDIPSEKSNPIVTKYLNRLSDEVESLEGTNSPAKELYDVLEKLKFENDGGEYTLDIGNDITVSIYPLNINITNNTISVLFTKNDVSKHYIIPISEIGEYIYNYKLEYDEEEE